MNIATFPEALKLYQLIETHYEAIEELENTSNPKYMRTTLGVLEELDLIESETVVKELDKFKASLIEQLTLKIKELKEQFSDL